MMNRYRRKPVILEAVQYTGGNEETLKDFLMIPVLMYETDGRFLISGPDGALVVYPNDWIVKGVEGEFYPLKPEIFDVLYEKVFEEPEPKQDVSNGA